MVSRLLLSCLSALLILTACRNELKNKQKVQEAILSRLQTHSGLDMQSMDVSTTAVSFEKNMAYATVSFHPKGDPAVNGGMTMKYTLEERGGQWVVVKVGDSAGHSMSMPSQAGASSLPPGHPSIDQGAGPADPHSPALTQ